MKKIAIGVLLFGSVLLAGQSIDKEDAAPAAPTASTDSQTAAGGDNRIVSGTGQTQPAKARHADLRYSQNKTAERLELLTLNGVSLADDKDAVLTKKGKPAHIVSDPHFKDQEILVYPDLEVALDNGTIAYLAIPQDAETFQLDGQTFPNKLNLLVERLGEPGFRAEDGLVYMNAYSAIKLYVQDETLQSIHLFSRAGE